MFIKVFDYINRQYDLIVSIINGQLFLLPKINKNLLRIYGKVSFRGKRRNLTIGRNVVFLGNATLVCGWDAPDGRIDIQDGCQIEHGCYLNAHGGSISIGTNTFLGVRSVVQGKGGVLIGKNTMLGPNTQIYSSDHPVESFSGYRKQQPEICLQVSIGDNVWLGANAIILGGTELDEGSVVGAGAVVRGIYPRSVLLLSKARLAEPSRVISL